MKAAAASAAMNPAENSGVSTLDCEYQQLMSDLFHDLSQPLSTLTCLLEVNLLMSHSLKQLRHDLKAALQQAHTIVRLFRNLRELWEAGNAPQDQQVLSLDSCLREALANLRPVAEPANARFSLICKSGASSSDCLVNFQASRLRQALFHLLEFAVFFAAAGSEVKIAAGEEDDTAQVTVKISAVSSKSLAAGSAAESVGRKQQEMKRRLGLEIARRIFESADGSLRTEDNGEQLEIEVRLPSTRLSK